MELINRLLNQEILTEQESKDLLTKITDGTYNDSQIVAAMTALQLRPITVNELQGFKSALLNMAIVPHLSYTNAIDVCGTGGDGKNTFNISTISAFVLATAGYTVIKHGNYGVSSFCGSSTILEQLGYQFTSDENKLQQQLDQTNICFLHAPLFHPCLKRVSQIRQQLKIRTFFNYLGPLVNPVQPNFQLAGVFNLKIARLYKELLSDIRQEFKVVFSLDGYDEVSLTSPYKLYGHEGEAIYYPSEVSDLELIAEDLYGGQDLEEAKQIFVNIISGKGNAKQNEIIKINAALGMQCFEPGLTLDEAMKKAEETLLSGKVKDTLDQLITLSQQ